MSPGYFPAMRCRDSSASPLLWAVSRPATNDGITMIYRAPPPRFFH
jgi:hypothetical protein